MLAYIERVIFPLQYAEVICWTIICTYVVNIPLAVYACTSTIGRKAITCISPSPICYLER